MAITVERSSMRCMIRRTRAARTVLISEVFARCAMQSRLGRFGRGGFGLPLAKGLLRALPMFLGSAFGLTFFFPKFSRERGNVFL